MRTQTNVYIYSVMVYGRFIMGGDNDIIKQHSEIPSRSEGSVGGCGDRGNGWEVGSSESQVEKKRGCLRGENKSDDGWVAESI